MLFTMSARMRATSGTYKVRENEIIHTKTEPPVKAVKCVVHFLDDTSHTVEVDRRSKAQVLLELVYNHLDLIEKDYFSLQYEDDSDGPTEKMRWIDPLKSVKRQIKSDPPYHLYFSVKFYVIDPSKLQEEYTRYHFFLQIKKDIVDGKLVCPTNVSTLLGSYAIQSELGDYSPEEHRPGYLSDFRLDPKQDKQFEAEVVRYHQQHKGQTPADAEQNYLERVKHLETYGVDLHDAKDSSGVDIQLGVTGTGLVVFRNHRKVDTFTWAKIIKISFKRKQFFIQVRGESSDMTDTVIGFNMFTYRSCKILWKSCVEYHSFFRLHHIRQLPRKWYQLGSKFRYSGRTEYEAQQSSKRLARVDRPFQRTASNAALRHTISGTGLSTRNAHERRSITGHVSSSALVKTQPPKSSLRNSFSASNLEGQTAIGRQMSQRFINTSLPKTPVLGNSNHPCYVDLVFNSGQEPFYQARLEHCWDGIRRSRVSLTSDRGSPWSNSFHVQQNGRREDDGGFISNPGSQRGSFSAKRDSMASTGAISNHVSNRDLTATPSSVITANSLPRSTHNGESNYTPRSYTPRADPLTSLPRSHTNHTNSSLSRNHSTKLEAVALPRSHSTMDTLGRGKAAPGTDLTTSASLPRSVGLVMNGGTNGTHISNGSAGYKQQSMPPQTSKFEYSDLPNENGFLDNHSLVTIHMQPDDQGRFGFNVKGGIDQGMPIIVSRVAPGMPADISMPRLNEGDQVLFINGRDVTQHKHEQVVMFIRAARETHSGELVLVVRPNVYVGEDYKEPEFHYVPETHHISAGVTGLDILSESIMLLREGVESGAAIAQFEQVYRRKPGLTNQCAKAAENLSKNRYRDISPYDQTRVILRNLPSGDYINANYINMEIPGSGIINRYIAAQGPLPNTCADFWEMVWQQQITLVVMLTALVERGRIKCHQYWPHLYETTDFGTLQLTCLKEKESRSFAFREFTLVNMETNEERHIYQMQYIAWPDHGVPDDSSDFLDFVIRVRQKRIGMVEPTLVHCSAGIGRTGVLILMETAMCLIESNQPVYPLDIVRQMRDQRAMLIQTSGQYKFVCEAILRVYHEGFVKPLDDFRQ